MADIQKEIVVWLKSLKGWQTELAYRILTQETISDNDISDIVIMIKNNSVFGGKDFPNFMNSGMPENNIRLKSIESISNIESLAPRNPLKFEDNKNLIVIYGSNGSGKSGYTKLIKKASGKPRATKLKTNVFNTSTDQSKCIFKYLVNEHDRSNEWKMNDAAIEDLSYVDVYDTVTGDGYLKEANTVAYTPICITLFEALSKYYGEINQRLETEKANLQKKISVLPSNYNATKSGAIYNKLTPKSTEASLTPILLWTDEDEKLRSSIEERLKEKDPVKLASEKRKNTVEIRKIIAEIDVALKLVTPEAKAELFALRNDSLEKRQTAIDGAKILLDKSEIQGVGSLVWRSLWEAAKSFSVQEAYKGKEYPNIEDESRCVLCHQVLDEDTKVRLLSFEGYVKSQLEIDAKKSEKIYSDRIKILPVSLTKDSITSKCGAANLSDDWIDRLFDIWNYFSVTSEAIKTGNVDSVDKTSAVNVIKKELELLSEQLEKQALQLDNDAKKFDRLQAEKDLLELMSKKWCSEQKLKILEEIERLKKVAQFESWISETTTNAITKQANVVSEVVITSEYITRFNKELLALGATRIKVELVKERGAKGVVKHSIKLKGVGNVKLEDVLSEGEYRVISLAAFLSDVTGGNNNNTFVFDDPISSLDQSFEEKMVERLVELSQTRQVIVFTHRLSLLGQLNDKSDSNKIQIIGIRQEHWGAGEVGETQLFAKKTDKALANIKNDKIAKAKKIYKDHGYDEYYPHGKMLCSDIRIVVERIVELDFLADVVQRYRRAVNTMGKVDKLAKINKDDCNLINDFMTRYSFYEHSQPGETPVEIPEPLLIESDVNQLLTWLEEFNKR